MDLSRRAVDHVLALNQLTSLSTFKQVEAITMDIKCPPSLEVLFQFFLSCLNQLARLFVVKIEVILIQIIERC